ncbi:D-arabinono-1,4-lactone oxidase [Microbacterium azadirachtae]|uniref:D-arabinono-1,4-lactone oxidase n=1 Tax=Microbacterium azadirachtae TaxID=582680 RepID=UPI00088B798E|nr:D-arabinono-1,4-lactone oxidase [Microbacterium azadirachtae]SDM02255.1 FAD-linked oxidoreductase [Microbacterium azadirachtae]SEG27839.1 FAD-linked oxidoreductase [Microbacterium azadirachtae]SEG30840.1 FAD-linked oxidoreductase [Microbacterium azadirachtae]
MTRPGGTWQNWGRSASIRPIRVERPRSPEGVQRAVRAAAAQNLRVKAVGAGHSFTGVAVAPDVLLELDDLQGLVSADEARGRVTLLAGTRLHRIPALLAPYGLAMENLGDIDRQSISGAISTGTHGTGAGFRGIAAQVVGVTLITAAGEFLRVDETQNAELLPALALGLGALGILVEVTLQCVPAFVMHAVDAPAPLDEVLDSVHERVGAADHFEFYWFPHTDVALTKTTERLPESAVRRPLPKVGKWIDETLLSNGVYRAVCAAGVVVPAITPSFSRLAVKLTGDREYTDLSHRVLTQSRTVRFREMEYAVPQDQVVPVFRAVQALIAQRGWRIEFPIEVRFAAADDRWLSTAHGRESAYIAVHRYWRHDPREYFDAVEAICLAHGGRPHWGKLHSLDAEQLRERYPRFDDFLALRDRLDPERRFSNRYLERVLGA